MYRHRPTSSWIGTFRLKVKSQSKLSSLLFARISHFIYRFSRLNLLRNIVSTWPTWMERNLLGCTLNKTENWSVFRGKQLVAIVSCWRIKPRETLLNASSRSWTPLPTWITQPTHNVWVNLIQEQPSPLLWSLFYSRASTDDKLSTRVLFSCICAITTNLDAL